MPARRWSKLAILHKLETAYRTDPLPLAADGIVATNINFTPIQADQVSRDLLLPYMGNQGVVLAGEHGRIEFDVEIAGGGAAGTVPNYGSLLRACGMSETVTAGVSVEYGIVEDDQESSAIYFNSDGVQHIFLGGRANVQMTWTPKQIPKFRFNYVGLLGEVADAALPAVTMAGVVTPLVVNMANTTMSLHGWPSVAESLQIDLGNTLTPRFLIGDEKVMISARSSTGTAVVEARHVADIDWFGVARKRTRGPLELIHGTTGGNIVEAHAPAVELGMPTQGQTDGIVNYSLPLSLCPVTAMDELKIIIR